MTRSYTHQNDDLSITPSNQPVERYALLSALGLSHHDAMTKQIVLTRDSDIEDYRERLRASAEQTQIQIAEIAGSESPLEFLFKLKFHPLGCDPFNPSRQLNLIEQLNQTFTYLASLNGAEFLFARHPKVQRLTLNLGTSAGWDIETLENDGVVAEVFAAVTPRNNRKLENDIEKVSAAQAKHRYVLFMSPEHDAGPYQGVLKAAGVIVWSLGCAL